MKRYQTWIFACVVVAVVAYAYFISFKGKEKDEAKKAEVSKLFTWKAADIATVKVEGRSKYEFAQAGLDAWTVTAPISDLGDAVAIDALVSSVLDLKSEDVVAEGGDVKFDLFGFNTGTRRVTLKNKAGEERTIALGTETGISAKRFARINSETKVHLVDPSVWNQLDRSVSDFRDKNLFHSVIGDVQEFQLSNGAEKRKGETALVKKSGTWELRGQPEVGLDVPAIERFFQALHEAKASDLIDKDKVKDAGTFGLNHPLYTLTVRLAGGAERKIEVSGPIAMKSDGSKASGKAVFNYARVSDRTPIFSVGANVTELLTKNVMDFRDKTLPFQFDADKVERMDLKTPLSELHLKKGIDKKWSEVTSAPDREIDQDQIPVLFSSMKNQRVGSKESRLVG